MLSVIISDIAIITVKNVDYGCIIHNISKSEAIKLWKNSVLENRGYVWKDILLNFSLFKTVSLLLTLLSIYTMVDIMGVYKSLKISIVLSRT